MSVQLQFRTCVKECHYVCPKPLMAHLQVYWRGLNIRMDKTALLIPSLLFHFFNHLPGERDWEGGRESLGGRPPCLAARSLPPSAGGGRRATTRARRGAGTPPMSELRLHKREREAWERWGGEADMPPPFEPVRKQWRGGARRELRRHRPRVRDLTVGGATDELRLAHVGEPQESEGCLLDLHPAPPVTALQGQ
jgi:hypothetical protein